MPRPYNKKTVRDAILLLDILGSNDIAFEDAADAAEVRPSSTGYRVADYLFRELSKRWDADTEHALICGEAAGLLREGWRIGDPIPKHPNEVAATLESISTIIREQYGAGNIEAMANAPSFAQQFSEVDKMLAEPLDAVEEPADEEIDELREDPTHEDPYGMEASDLDTTEPSE